MHTVPGFITEAIHTCDDLVQFSLIETSFRLTMFPDESTRSSVSTGTR